MSRGKEARLGFVLFGHVEFSSILRGRRGKAAATEAAAPWMTVLRGNVL